MTAPTGGDGLDGPRRVVFKPLGVRVLAGLVWVALAVYVVLLFLQGTAADAVRFLPVAALIALVVYATFWRPAVVVDDEDVVLVNVLRDVRMPFARLDSVDTHYAMRLESGDRTYSAWAAPAPGRTSAMSLNRREASATALLGTNLDQGISASAAPNTDSGGAALMVRVRWLRWIERQAGAATTSTSDDAASPADVSTTWNVCLGAALAVLLVASVLVIVL